MLARALYKNAPIIVLDEPTSALDPIAEADIYNKYNELAKNKSSLFISHRLASTRFCDRILFIADEKIVKLLEQMAGSFKILLAILFSVSTMLLIGITLVIQISNSGLMYR